MPTFIRPALIKAALHAQSRTLSTTTRAMAPKQEWLAIVPDYPGALAKRMEVRPKHLEAIKPNVGSGTIVFGGASLDEPIKEGEGPKINGSVMIICADSKEEAMKVIESDVYVESKVWDLSKIQIFPFKSAVRVGL